MAAEGIGHAAAGVDLVQAVALLGAGVVAVPLFRRLGLGSVLGYLAAGLAVGPFGLKLINDPEAILHAAELGVVMFLFIIGLEMQPSRLWNLRRQIFGLGAAQVILCGGLLTGIGVLLGFSPVVAFVFGMGFVLTSTAIVMQVLEERGDVTSPPGQRIVSILLLEDLAIVPLLAVIALLAPRSVAGDAATPGWIAVLIALAAVLVLSLTGRWVLNPMFRILAKARAREVMTAAALLVVLGAALLMQVSGLSMAMGAFLAGVLLSTSSFKHQLEADVEPFRGILLGLFFLAVGMSLDLSVVLHDWRIIGLSVLAYMLVKGLAIYGLARVLRAGHAEAVERAVLMSQGGEFAFVLYTTAATAGIIDGPTGAIFTATVIISMAITPFTLIALRQLTPKAEQSMDGVEEADGLRGDVLVIGFGRFGQIATQPLLAMRHKVSIIDNDTDMIRAAGQFGAKVYYGDGTRLDILRAAGAGQADLVLICVNDPQASLRIATLIRDEFPLVKVMARAFDRRHAIELVKLDVQFQMRETFESALELGRESIMLLGGGNEDVSKVIEGVRSRDRRRFEAQILGGIRPSEDLLLSNATEQARETGIRAAALPEKVDAAR